MKASIKRPDLVALTSDRGTGCCRTIGGEKIYDFKRVIITVNNADGSKKKYDVFRASFGSGSYKHSIESHTIMPNAPWYDDVRGKCHKWYSDATFDAKLQKLAREIAKTDHAIRVLD